MQITQDKHDIRQWIKLKLWKENGIYASIKSIHNYIDQSESFKDKIVCNYNAWINIVK